MLYSNRFLVFVLILFVFCEKSSAQDSLQTVIATKGDGIYGLLRKQGLDPIKYYKAFIELNKENLKDSIGLYQGKSYLIPTLVKDSVMIVSAIDSIQKPDELLDYLKDEYPIFGKEHAKVLRKSKRLAGTVYYLVSGHGGPDPGAVEDSDGVVLAEDEYAYDITLRLARELVAHGALVYLIIKDEDDGIRSERILAVDRDELCYPEDELPLSQLGRLKQRTLAVNGLYLKHKGQYQRLIVTHIDSRSKSKNIDVFFYHHKKSKKGKLLAESIHTTFLKKYKKHQPNREYSGQFRIEVYMLLIIHIR